MRKSQLLVIGAIALTTLVGITAAVISQENIGDSSTPSTESSQLATPASSPTAELESLPRAASYPRQPLTLVDQAEPSSDFFEFRERLRQAIRDRDADHIRSIAHPEIRLSFGPPETLDDLEIDNPNAPIWAELEKAIGAGCVVYEIPDVSAPETWVCPYAFVAEIADDSVVIVGENVNVRAGSSTDSPVVGMLSNEVIKIDFETLERLTEEERSPGFSPDGWTPVIIPSGDRGYVQNQYVFPPLGYRAFFQRSGDRWMMDAFVSGD